MNNDILSIIKRKKNNFSKSQKMIADYIIENMDKAAYMTADNLAKSIGVSESTVVRFAVEIGFLGYPKFQKALQETAKTQLTSVQRMEIAYKKLGSRDILDSILKSDVYAIEKTLESIDKLQFENAVTAISNADKIYITGIRSAAALAEFAGFYMHLVFDNVRLIKSTGADDLFEQMLSIGKNDVVIGISFPRYSKNTIKALEYAKKNGATVIGITDSNTSPIVQESKFCLIAESDTTSFVDSLVAPFSVIHALTLAVGMKNKEKMQHNFEKLEQIWDEYGVYDK